MGSGQRKAILVLLNLPHRDLPSFHRVALFAVGAEFAAVNISVAVRALGARIGEHHFGVALSAPDRLMHAAERIAGLVVVELRNRADRSPAADRMTVLAGNIQVTVGTARVGITLRLSRRSRGQEQQHDNQIDPERRSQWPHPRSDSTPQAQTKRRVDTAVQFGRPIRVVGGQLARKVTQGLVQRAKLGASKFVLAAGDVLLSGVTLSDRVGVLT